MQSIALSRQCPLGDWGTSTKTPPMPEPSDVLALAVEIAKDLAEELGILPSALTPEQRAQVRVLVRQRYFPQNADGSRAVALTAARATAMTNEMNAQLDAALAAHTALAHP